MNEYLLILIVFGVFGLIYLLAFFVPYLRAARTGALSRGLHEFVDGLQQEEKTPGALSVRRVEGESDVHAAKVREDVGAAFAAWCRAANVSDESASLPLFHAALAERVGEGIAAPAQFDGAFFRIVPWEGDQAPEFATMWLVQAQGVTLLLPMPRAEGFFSVGGSIALDEGLVPSAVRSALPAVLAATPDERWSVASRGVVSADASAVQEALSAEQAPRYDNEIRTLAPFTRRYDNPFVQEAVQQIGAAYPAGDYRRFDLLRLPSYADYAERLSAARNMAGLFVLIGLGLTLLRLNSVVHGLASMSGQTGMDKDAFVQQMGEQLGGIGGAFTASLVGIVVMVGFLLLLGLRDRSVQARLAQLERGVAEEALPVLVRIQERDLRAATLPQILNATQQNLERLNETVQSLSGAMDASLSGLGERIESMLDKFGSFDARYGQLDEILRKTSEAAVSLTAASRRFELATTGLDAARQRLEHPLHSFADRIDALLVAQNSAIAGAQADYRRLSEELQAVQVATNAMAERFEHLLEQSLAVAQQQRAEGAAQQHAQLQVLAEGLRSFTDGVGVLGPVAATLQSVAAGQAQVSREMQASARRFGDSGQVLHRAAEQFERNGPQTVPPSLFSWLYNGLVSLRERGTGTPPAPWERTRQAAAGDGQPASPDVTVVPAVPASDALPTDPA